MKNLDKNHNPITKKSQIIEDYIFSCPKDTPILLSEIEEKTKIRHDIIIVYVNRMIRKNSLSRFSKGVYYRPEKGIFGDKKINPSKVINQKYLYKNGKSNGYITGEQLMLQLGLSTQVSHNTTIVSNVATSPNVYRYANFIIKRPKIKITDDNRRYLQFIDLLLFMKKAEYSPNDINKAIDRYCHQYDLDYKKIFHYAKKINCPKVINIMYEAAC